MYKVKIFNKIAENGLNLLKDNNYTLIEQHNDEDKSYQAIVLRSYKLQEADLSSDLMIVCRAGAGINNVPIDACSKRGVVVVNTPGQNANAVVELVMASLILTSRNIVTAINAMKNNAMKNVAKQDAVHLDEIAETMKKDFRGKEVRGKTLGVVGLGAIGTQVCRQGLAMGMKVIGYDPYITVQNAWRIPEAVLQANDIQAVFKKSDYVTLHLPSNDSTRNLIDEKILLNAKKNLHLFNFARGDIVKKDAIVKALEQKILDYYVTDFVDAKLIELPNVVVLPHLGASTKEAEDKCAISACQKAHDYFAYGTIQHSANFPDIQLDVHEKAKMRIAILHQNVPQMISYISKTIGTENVNILDLVNKSKDQLASTIMDLESVPSDNIIAQMSKENTIYLVRVIKF